MVTGAANLLVGLIIGLLGVSQLARFGAVAYVPELVVVAQFRELGPLVTAIVVAGRSGAGLASELATMKVSEEIDALRAMGFDPVRWLVVPRCLALVIVHAAPDLGRQRAGALRRLRGDERRHRHAAARVHPGDRATRSPPAHLIGGLVKTPFLALAIGLIACGQGLAAQGGAAAVGARTTRAVVLAILGVIVMQRDVHLLLRIAGHLTCRHLQPRPHGSGTQAAHRRRRSANRLGNAGAHGARELSGRARDDAGDPGRIGERQEHACCAT